MIETVLIIVGSSRKASDTKFYVDFVCKDINHKIIDLLDFNISHYSYDNTYSDTDNFIHIFDEILKHTIIVFATPVYWYAMSGVMKIFFDRLTDVVTTKKEIGRQLKNKSTFLLAVGSDKEMPPGFDIPFKLTSQYFGMIYESHIYFSTKHVEIKPEQEEAKNIFIASLDKSAAAGRIGNR